MARVSTNATSLFGYPVFPGFEPGNSGAQNEIMKYYSVYGVYAFFAEQPDYTYYDIFNSKFESPSNPRVKTTPTGTASAATYGTNGNLTLTSGTDSNGMSQATYEYTIPDFASIGYFISKFNLGTLGTGTGNGLFAIGVLQASVSPDHTNVAGKEGAWLTVEIVSGTPTYYVCTGNGTNVTSTDVTALLNPSQLAALSFVVTSSGGSPTSISFYQYLPGANDSLIATHTTNLPVNAPTSAWTAGVINADTNSRSAVLNSVLLVAQ